MAQDNQGLKIALIAFVMLAIILGVTTFIFYKNYDEARTQAAAAVNDKNAADQAKAKSDAEAARLKQLIGVAATDQLEAIDKVVNEDLANYGKAGYQGEKNLRAMLAYLNNVIHDRDVNLATLKGLNDDLNKRLVAREGIAQPKIDQAQKATAAATADYQKETEKFKQDRETLKTENTDLAGKVDKAAKETGTALAKVEETKAIARKQIKELRDLATDRDEKLTKLLKPTFETADGKITWVSQREGAVWINLGDADALGKLTSFSVYGSDTTNVAGAEKKASIEVTEVLGSHLAKARIIEDKLADPIVPGDLIHTPIWSPGDKKHFAICGVIDLDGDDKSDLQRVLSLIRLNGGVVDAYQDENGGRSGKITTGTNYLVKGKPPEASAAKSSDANVEKAWMENFTNMDKEADKSLVKKITLQDLLTQMGWKDQGRMVQFGRGAPANQFKVQPAEGGQPKSTGTVSPLFQPRQAPRSAASGAY